MNFETSNVLAAFGLTLFAGLSTGIGSALAFFARRTDKGFLSVMLGFSAGVMLYVSMIEIFPKAQASLIAVWGEKKGAWITVGSFFAGMFLIAVIDRLVPSFENPHETRDVDEMDAPGKEVSDPALYRMGLFSALAIAIHNFPEGLATFIATLKDPSLGLPIAIAIAIHNIPEGIAVSIPIFYATGDRRKAFFYSFLSGLSEPLGGLLGFFLLYSFFNETMFGVVFASVAGIMVFISLDELLPTARKYGEHHLSIYGLVSGMIVMALSLLLLA
jgi:ZIP family zinc transporter